MFLWQTKPNCVYIAPRRALSQIPVCAAISLGALLLSLQAAPGAAQTWTGGGGTNNAWSNPANWSGGVVPDSLSANAVFDTSNGQYGVFLDRDYSLNSLVLSGSSRYIYNITSKSASGTETDNALKIGAGGITANTQISQFFTGVVSLQASTSFISNIPSPYSLSFSTSQSPNQYSELRLNGYNLTVGGSGTTDILLPVVGTGSITKVDTGVLNLNVERFTAIDVIVNRGWLSTSALNVSTITNSATFVATGLVTASSVVNNSRWTATSTDIGTFVNGSAATLTTNGGQTRIGSLTGGGTVFLQFSNAELVLGALNRNDTLSGVISGPGSLTKTGGGTLTLLGNNTLTGSIVGNGGTIVVGDATHAATLGTGAVTNNAFLRFAGLATAKNSSITNNFILEFRDNATAGSTSITNGSSTSTAATAVSFLNNSSAGNATITNNKALYLQDASTAGGASIANAAGSSLDISNRTDSGVSVGSLSGEGAVFLGSKTLTVGDLGKQDVVYGVIQDGGISGASGGSLTKVGEGSLTLLGYNTYTGKTTVSGGTLVLNSLANQNSYYGAALSPSSTGVQINSGGYLLVAQSYQIPYNIPVTFGDSGSGAGAEMIIGNATTVHQNITMGNNAAILPSANTKPLLALVGAPATITVPANAAASIGVPVGIQGNAVYNVGSNASLSVSSGMSNWNGTGAVIKNGFGMLHVGGSSTYTGATSVNAGNLLVTGSLLSSGSVVVARDATLSGLGSVGKVTALGGAILAPGFDNAPGSGIGTLTFSSLSLSSGGILDFSLGLSGVSDQLVITGDNNAASADFVFSGGTPVFRFGDASTTGLTASEVIGQSYKLVRLTGNASTNVLSYTPQVRTGNGIQSISGTFSIVNDGTNSYLTYSPTSFQPVPAPPAAVSLAIGGGVGMLGTALQRLRRQRKSA